MASSGDATTDSPLTRALDRVIAEIDREIRLLEREHPLDDRRMHLLKEIRVECGNLLQAYQVAHGPYVNRGARARKKERLYNTGLAAIATVSTLTSAFLAFDVASDGEGTRADPPSAASSPPPSPSQSAARPGSDAGRGGDATGIDGGTSGVEQRNLEICIYDYANDARTALALRAELEDLGFNVVRFMNAEEANYSGRWPQTSVYFWNAGGPDQVLLRVARRHSGTVKVHEGVRVADELRATQRCRDEGGKAAIIVAD